MGKLVVPNVYLDVDLLKSIVTNYDPTIRVVRTHSGINMVDDTREGLIKVFKLIPYHSEKVTIDQNILKIEYEKVRLTFKVSILTNFMERGKG